MLSISPPAASGATFPKRTINTMSGFSLWVEINEQKFRENNQNCTESQIMQKMKYFWRAKMLTEEKQKFNRLCEQRKREHELEKMRINQERLREKNPNCGSREIQPRSRIAASRAQREEFVQELDEQWNQLPEDTKKPFMEKYQKIRNAQNENQQGSQRMSPPAYFPPNSRPLPLQENCQNFQQIQNQNQNSRQTNFQEPETDFQQIHNQDSRQMNYEESRIPEIQNSQNIPQGIPVRIVKIKRVVLKNHHGQRIQNHGNGNLRFVSKNPHNNGPRLVRILEKAPGHVPENFGNQRYKTNSRPSSVWKFGSARKSQISHNPVKMEIVDSEYSDSQGYENYPDASENFPQDHNSEFQESSISNQMSNDQNYEEYDYQEHLGAPNPEYDVFSPPEDQFVTQNGPKLYKIVKNEHPVAQNYQNRQFQCSRAHFNGSKRPNQDFSDDCESPEYSNQVFEDFRELGALTNAQETSGASEYAQNGHLQYPVPNSNAPIMMSNAENYPEYVSQGCQLVQRNVNQYGQSDQYSDSTAQPGDSELCWKGTNAKNAPEDAPGFSEDFKSEFNAHQEFRDQKTEFLAPDAPESSEMDSELENSNLAPDAPKPYSRKYENWPIIDPNERILFDLPDGPIWM
ncbi:hypothetical protein B9Z55_028099 [Caenorhabditis nigoni]|uniref:HMG box domain-containing protein n=1 Tax=Caenorhabditis nigoni TaxID=1611254 RepID=A0A2G5SCT2_9PELO|nr:hypothetical protein B9Z55_028099 [Caenorhabditis nigoni]